MYRVMESSFVRLYSGQRMHSELEALVRRLGYEFVAPVGFQYDEVGRLSFFPPELVLPLDYLDNARGG